MKFKEHKQWKLDKWQFYTQSLAGFDCASEILLSLSNKYISSHQ